MSRVEELELAAALQAIEERLRKVVDERLNALELQHAEDRKVLLQFIADLRAKLRV